jgi:hypothetical protein
VVRPPGWANGQCQRAHGWSSAGERARPWHWLGGNAIFLDLIGNVVLGPPERGYPEGFLGAMLRTYVRRAGQQVDVIWSHAAPEDEPPAPGIVPRIVQRIVAPLFERLATPRHRPTRLARPEALATALQRHLELVRDSAVEVLRPSGDLLEQRWAWEGEIENRATPGG